MRLYSKMSSVILSDEQRDHVRRMLESLGGKMDEPAPTIALENQGVDLFMKAQNGSTVEWSEVTPSSYKYQFVRESMITFVPLILSGEYIEKEEIMCLCRSLGTEPYESSSSLITCSVEQSDPICIFHVAMIAEGTKRKISTVRYVC